MQKGTSVLSDAELQAIFLRTIIHLGSLGLVAPMSP